MEDFCMYAFYQTSVSWIPCEDCFIGFGGRLLTLVAKRIKVVLSGTSTTTDTAYTVVVYTQHNTRLLGQTNTATELGESVESAVTSQCTLGTSHITTEAQWGIS